MLPPRDIAGRFRLDRIIGEGGMGIVYRGVDLQSDAVVAVKVVTHTSAAAVERFERESRMLAELDHPHVVRWVAHGVSDDGNPYLAMEWLEGEDLADRLKRGSLSPAEAVRLAINVADALEAVHELGITHRDIKPDNIFLKHGAIDDLRVLDFGIARSEQHPSLTRTGMMLGTVGFMAPEQINAGGAVGPWSDIFALGCVLFECLTGRQPFAAAQPMAVMIKIMLEDAPRVRELAPDVPAVLDELLACMLERDIEHRIGSASELLTALRMIESQPLSLQQAPRPSLTSVERRVVSVIVAAAAEVMQPRVESTLPLAAAPIERRSAAERALMAVVAPYGATLETPDGSLVVALLAGEGTTTVQTMRAASCALAMRKLLPDVPMVLVTGLCVVADRLPVGPLIDRAVDELERAPRVGVGVDEHTGRLIAERFDVAAGEHGFVLLGESARPRTTDEGVRPESDAHRLLGQATPCVGRERDIANLLAIFDECVSEEVACTAIVTGPPGLGKTRLVREVLRSLAERDATIIEGRGDAVAPGVAFGILGRAIRAAAGLVGGESVADARARIAERVREHLPAADHATVVPFIAELAGAPFDGADDLSLRAARTAPALMTTKLEQAFTRWLEAECAHQPVVLVLEDLHWADAMSVRLVERALEKLAESPFMVIATGRPELFDIFASLRKIRGRQEIALAGISKKAAQRLVRAVVGDRIAPEMVTRIVERADGNPFFLEELVRHAAEGRADTLPTSLISIVHARLDELEPDTRRLLRAASIVGDVFRADTVAHLTAERPSVVASRLADLVDRELLQRRATPAASSDDAQLGFSHALVREVAYATLTDDDRRLGHRLAAEWFEHHGAGEPSSIASHFELGGQLARAATWYERAARAALEASDLDGAIARAQRGFACKPEPSVTIDLHLVAGRAYRWKADLDRASANLQIAFEALPRGSRDWFRAGGDLVNVVARLDMWELSRAAATAMMETPASCDEDRAFRATALARAAHMLCFPRRDAIGESVLRAAQAEHAALPVEDLQATAQVRATEAGFYMSNGQPGPALRTSMEAVRLFELMGDRQVAHVERVAVLTMMNDMGLYDEIVARGPAWIAETATLTSPFAGAIMRTALGRAHAALGDLAAARREIEQAVTFFGSTLHQVAWPLAQLAQVDLAEGAIDDAERHASEGAHHGRWFVAGHAANLACLAWVELARGNVLAAKARIDEALASVAAQLGVAQLDTVVHRAHLDVLYALGDHAEADRQLGIVLEVLRARLDNIDDPAWREAYLASRDVRLIHELAARRGR